MLIDLRAGHLPAVIDMAIRVSDESPVYSRESRDRDYMLAYAHNAYAAGLLIGCLDNDMRGCMFGSVSGNWTSPALKAAEWLLYVKPEHRGTRLAWRMVERFQELARLRGAKTLYVGSSTGINDEGVRKLYERMGFQSVGSSLMKELHV